MFLFCSQNGDSESRTMENEMRAIQKIGVALAALAMAAAAYAAETITYAYDARGRLVKIQHSGSVNNNVSTNYQYDRADNRTLKNTTGVP